MGKTGADIILHTLKNAGIKHVFGYPGANILPVHDRLMESSIEHYLMRHEQGAAHAADGYARSTGKVGVCIATSGPGATNLVTGIATAYMDSIPMIALTGQVTTDLLGSDAFQETDIIGITMPITKHSFLVTDVNDMEEIICQALEIATSGRPGPVLIDLPKDVLTAECEGYSRKKEDITPKEKKSEMDRESIERLEKIAWYLNKAERPVLLIGGGVKLGGACDELTQLVEKGKIPFVATMMGVGSASSTNGFNLGFVGTHGTELANHIIHQSDFILAIGARFTDRTTSLIEEFAPLATIAQIDIDPTSIGKNIKTDIALVSDIRTALRAIIPLVNEGGRPEWVGRIRKEKERLSKKREDEGCGLAGSFIKRVQSAMPDNTIAVADVGLNQIWTIRSWQARRPNSLLVSGGMGTMGFSIPASIGAKIGNSDRSVVSFSGDGGFFMNLQELATISYYDIPVKMIVFNNGNLGMIRQLQDLFYSGRFSESALGNKADITAIAKGFGIKAEKISVNKPENGIEKMCAADEPFLLEVMIDQNDYVYPIIPPGKSNVEMIYGKMD